MIIFGIIIKGHMSAVSQIQQFPHITSICRLACSREHPKNNEFEAAHTIAFFGQAHPRTVASTALQLTQKKDETTAEFTNRVEQAAMDFLKTFRATRA